MSDTTSRYGIVEPSADRSDAADVPYYIRQAVAAIERSVMFGQGTLAARPVSTSGSPGIQGRIYATTDETPRQVYYDYGTGWFQVGALAAGAVGTAQLADGAVTAIKMLDGSVVTAKVGDGAITTAKLVDGAVTSGKIASALKPSQGAGGAVEALRALGVLPGQAASGAHASQHAPGGADQLKLPMAYMYFTLGGGGFGAAPDVNYRVFTTASLVTDIHNTLDSWVIAAGSGQFRFPQAGTYMSCWGMDIKNQETGTCGVFLSDENTGSFVPGGARASVLAGGDPSANITRSGVNSGPRLLAPDPTHVYRLGGYWSGGSDVSIWVLAVLMPF